MQEQREMVEKSVSHIREIDLQERVGETWTKHDHQTAVSILRPVIHIEKASTRHLEPLFPLDGSSGKNSANWPDSKQTSSGIDAEQKPESGMYYRVIASFILEVQILDFDH